MSTGLTACGGNTGDSGAASSSSSNELADSNKEMTKVRWNMGTSGNIMVIIAEEKGYLAEEGIELEFVQSTANADAMALLATGKVDVVSNSGTSNPLQQIASGIDISVFGGHMVDGSMPIIAREETEWNGFESLIGKKFACNPSYFALTGKVKELGYEDPLSAVDWVVYANYNDAIAAVVQGEVDYALLGTGQNMQAKTMDGIKIVAYQGDAMENYSCCRLVAPTPWINENPEAIKGINKALIRAREYFENNKEEAVKLMAEAIGADEEYIAAFMYNDNYIVNPDPLKNSVVRAWGILDDTGFLNENAKQIDILEHINTDLYKEALDEVIAEHGSENPEFYENLLAFYNENNL